MSYMGHSDNCTCAECYVRRQQTPPAPVAIPAQAQQEMRGLGLADPEWKFIGGTIPSQVKVRESVPLPAGVDWPALQIVGAARLDVDAGEVVALLARVTWGPQMTLAIWWDRDKRELRAHGVEA